METQSERRSKHDADCLRRKDEFDWGYICSCAMTDEQVQEALVKSSAAAGETP